MHLSFRKNTLYLSLILLMVGCTVDIKPVQVQHKVILAVNWGSGKGEIGEVPGSREPHTAGESINPIAVDSKGNIYVGDSVNFRVQKYNSSGKFQLAINLQSYQEWPFIWPKIPDIYIDKDDNVYIVMLRAEKIGKFNPNGKLLSIYNYSSAGTLEKDVYGVIKLNKNKLFYAKKIRVDSGGNVHIEGGDVLKINREGEIIQRWGPDASNIFIDENDNLYVYLPAQTEKSTYKRFDKNGTLIGIGLGVYEDIIQPEYMDSLDNTYGFATDKDRHLIKYNAKNKKGYKFPFKSDDLIEERWTIDLKGNVYYTNSHGRQFEVIKMSILSTDVKKGNTSR